MTKKIKKELRKHFRATIYYTIISSRFCATLNRILIIFIKYLFKSYLKISIPLTVLTLILSPLILGIYLQSSLWLLLIPLGIYLSNELIKYEINKLKK